MEAAQRIPSGVVFDPIHLQEYKKGFGTREEGVDPRNIFPSFEYLSNEQTHTGIEGRCLPLLDVDIDVEAESNIAKTKVIQTFTNPSYCTIKRANYSFPLYDGSVVVAFKCHIGVDRLLEGVVKTKDVSWKCS